ncbi:MAG: dipeptide epimerase [Gemmatimonadota bacterium]|nr:dipeptide epimerase [Gemmatimonadota bacterium]
MELTWERLAIRPEVPFRIARSVQETVERVWVRVTCDGLEGWGEADPSPYYGESAGSVEAALARLRPVLEAEPDPDRLEAIERRIREAVPGDAAARTAVSAALHDLFGKRLGQPLWRLLGLDPADAPRSSFTIGLDEPDAMADRVRAAAGWPILKIKLGTERDEEILRAVRDADPSRVLRVDANAAWTPETAVRHVRLLADLGVEMVEQPLPPGDPEGWRAVREASPIPVYADESCLVASDVPKLAGLVDGVNIKLAKCGGLREALRAVHAARACGLEVMFGCMLETTLGIAAAAHLAPLADRLDLDGAALLARDPFAGPRLEEARLRLGPEPGLGVRRR